MDIIKYHNDINKLRLGNFTENETDIFFSLLFKVKENKEDVIIMSFSELKALANGDKNKDRFIKNILGLNVKLKAMSQTLEVEKGVFETFSLFGTIRTDTNKKTIEVPIEKKFRYLIEGIMENYTLLDLKQLVSLKGNYPKILYRLLKQFETTRLYIVKIDDFRELMGIPQTYKMINIRQKVFKPCLEQLGKHFEALEIIEIKKGRNTETLQFIWKAKKKQKKVENIEVVEAVKMKQGLKEEDLREHEEREAKVKEEALKKETEAKEEKEKTHKMKITREAYAHLYHQHCKEHNIDPNNKVVKLAFDQANLKKYEFIEEKKRKIRPKKTMIIGTEISEDLLLSAKGKKLFGMARKNKIEKILEQMARREAIRNFKYNYKFIVIEGAFGSGKSKNIEDLFEKLKETLSLEEMESLLKKIQK